MQIIPTEPLPAHIGLVYAIDYSPDGSQLVLYQPAPDDTGNIHG